MLKMWGFVVILVLMPTAVYGKGKFYGLVKPFVLSTDEATEFSHPYSNGELGGIGGTYSVAEGGTFGYDLSVGIAVQENFFLLALEGFTLQAFNGLRTTVILTHFHELDDLEDFSSTHLGRRLRNPLTNEERNYKVGVEYPLEVTKISSYGGRVVIGFRSALMSLWSVYPYVTVGYHWTEVKTQETLIETGSAVFGSGNLLVVKEYKQVLEGEEEEYVWLKLPKILPDNVRASGILLYDENKDNGGDLLPDKKSKSVVLRKGGVLYGGGIRLYHENGLIFGCSFALMKVSLPKSDGQDGVFGDSIKERTTYIKKVSLTIGYQF